MALISKLEGVAEVLSNLNRSNAALAVRFEQGVKLAGLMLQRESQKLVPVHFGVLKNSAFTRAEGSGFDTDVNVGYTAAYAVYVHEAVGMVLKGQPRTGKNAHGRYWDPQGRAQAKFLEEPARRLTPQLLKMIQQIARIQ